MDQRFLSDRFPRSNAYHPDWIIAGVSGGANPLWLAEWLTEAVPLQPGMRVLDLGCGRGMSSIFFHREFGVQVWAMDLWCSPSENLQRIRDAGAEDQVFPIHAEARSLPFAEQFFDAILSIDSYVYYGTDDLYLNYLARFLKPGGVLGIAGAGVMQELTRPIPEHLQAWWEPEMWSLHSADWWCHHWAKTGIMAVEIADALPDGWKYWLDWHRTICPENKVEIAALEADQGRNFGYVRVVGRRAGQSLSPMVTSVTTQYTPAPLLRDPVTAPASRPEASLEQKLSCLSPFTP